MNLRDNEKLYISVYVIKTNTLKRVHNLPNKGAEIEQGAVNIKTLQQVFEIIIWG